MRLLTQKDEELLNTIHLINKFPKRQVVFFQTLEAEYQANFSNKEIAFAYGYYQYFNYYVKGSVSQKEVNVTAILEAYTRAIELDSTYWLAQMCQALCILKFPFVMNSEQIMKDMFNQMVELQGRASQPEGYFIIPYLLYSDFLFSLEKYDLAFEVLLDGIRKTVLEPIGSQFFRKFFGIIFKEFYNRVTFAKEEALFNILEELGERIFPEYIQKKKVVI